VGEQDAGFKRGARARTWPENARSWARPQREIMGERLETADSGDGGTERGGAGARERTNTDKSGPRDREREREGGRRARVSANRRDPPVKRRGHARGLGEMGRLGLKWPFLFS
jgi:hypothetical protein